MVAGTRMKILIFSALLVSNVEYATCTCVQSLEKMSYVFLKFHFPFSGLQTYGYKLIAFHQYCNSEYEKLDSFRNTNGVEECALECKNKGCKYFYIHGTTSIADCYWAKTESEDCEEGWKKGNYDSYAINYDGKLYLLKTFANFIYYLCIDYSIFSNFNNS